MDLESRILSILKDGIHLLGENTSRKTFYIQHQGTKHVITFKLGSYRKNYKNQYGIFLDDEFLGTFDEFEDFKYFTRKIKEKLQS